MQLALAGLCLLALGAATRASTIAGAHIAVVIVLFAASALRPTVGLALIGLLLPLAHALTLLMRSAMAPPQVAESLVLAFVAGAAMHFGIKRDTLQGSRLGWPALLLAGVVAVAAACAVLAQMGGVADGVREIWRHLLSGRLAGGSRVPEIEPSIRWMEVLALAVCAELALRRAPAMGRVVLVAWLAAGAGAAAQTALQVVQAVVSRGEGLGAAVNLFATTRISVLFPDVNAAGSLFALIAVTAIVLAVKSPRRLTVAIAAPFAVGALLATKSRAAIVAACLVLGALAVWTIGRSGRRWLAAVVAVVILGAAVAFVLQERQTHVGAGAALRSRLEMSRIALKITREAPVFGVGAGRFLAASRDFLEPAFVATFPEAATGENAHNNFLQVLAEFGLVGLMAFVWVLWRALATSPTTTEPGSPERLAVVAGLSAFLISALLGHPLLIYGVAVNFFFALGVAAGLAPSLPPPGGRAPLLVMVLGSILVMSLPWRVSAALAPAPPAVIGATDAAEPLDGVAYRIAEQTSRWRLRAHSRVVVLPLRWAAEASRDCRVQVVIHDRRVDEVVIGADAWSTLRFVIPPERLPSTPPEIELRVTSPACRLLVGPITTTR